MMKVKYGLIAHSGRLAASRSGGVNADFHAAYLASLLAELEVKATAVPPGDGGVGGEGGLAEDG